MSGEGIFDVITSQNNLNDPNEGVTQNYWEQVAPSRDVTGFSNLAGGIVKFSFQNDPSEWCLLNRSYFRLRVRYGKGAQGTTQVERKDQMGPGVNVVASMLSSIKFLAGGNIVSSCTEHVAQVDTVMKRLRRTGSNLRSSGLSNGLLDHSLMRKVNMIASDGVRPQDYTIHGDIKQDAVTLADADLTAYNVDGKLFRTDEKTNIIEICWQPDCLGIWNQPKALAAGKYEVQLVSKPSGVFPLSAIHSGGFGQTATKALGDLKVDILGLDLFVQKVRGPSFGNSSDPQQYFIEKSECVCQTGLVGTAPQKTQNFEVSPKTNAVTLAFQDRLCATDTRMPEALFKSYGDPAAAIDPTTRHESALERLFFTYGGRAYPSPDDDIKSGLGTAHKFDTRRYLNTQLASGMWENGDVETIKEWGHDRGPIYHHLVTSENKSNNTRLSVTHQFSTQNIAARVEDINLLVFSHYPETIRLVLQHGTIKQVDVDRR